MTLYRVRLHVECEALEPFPFLPLALFIGVGCILIPLSCYYCGCQSRDLESGLKDLYLYGRHFEVISISKSWRNKSAYLIIAASLTANWVLFISLRPMSSMNMWRSPPKA